MWVQVILRQAFSKASDVYAFGLILWELITWDVPFKEMSQFQVRWSYIAVHGTHMPVGTLNSFPPLLTSPCHK